MPLRVFVHPEVESVERIGATELGQDTLLITMAGRQMMLPIEKAGILAELLNNFVLDRTPRSKIN